MSLNAYERTVRAAATPQDNERRALAEASRRLQVAHDGHAKGPALVEALDFNRNLWRIFAADCQRADNGLPTEIRASIISIKHWVERHSSLVAAGEDSVEAMIKVNAAIFEGLGMQSRA